MTDQTGAVTVYRSADQNAEQDATAVYNLLARSGLDAQLAGPHVPGVVVGAWEVRVPADQAGRAETLVATMDVDDPGRADPSRELDMVTFRRTQGATGELEAISIRTMLEANDIPSIVVGASTLPNLAFFVNVAKADLERAETALAEAKIAGPAAAVEGALQSEGQEPTS